MSTYTEQRTMLARIIEHRLSIHTIASHAGMVVVRAHKPACLWSRRDGSTI
ncbi:hypothetical protein [Rhizobium leguminosarum]|uniref:hypothetical protein n=1 Tax=Rhizobium leguminosarum TaxID=384 RepID=UPI0014423ED5|nr:hypothetical protein [Rhizobium leguminosarum]MBY5870396.1 hypothetical protein [Rhizobium leguminosarum]